MLFWQFTNIIIYVKIVGKIPNQHYSVWFFSYPGDKVQILVESTRQICPIVLHLFWTLSPGFENNHIFKCWSDIFPTILTYLIMLENCQKNILVYGCSPIQGTKLLSCWNLMKPGSQSETYMIVVLARNKIRFLARLGCHNLAHFIYCTKGRKNHATVWYLDLCILSAGFEMGTMSHWSHGNGIFGTSGPDGVSATLRPWALCLRLWLYRLHLCLKLALHSRHSCW